MNKVLGTAGIVWAVLLLVGCSMAGHKQAVPTPNGRAVSTERPISTEQDALDVALKIATTPDPLGCCTSEVPPRKVQAEKTTLTEAVHRLGTEGLGLGNAPDMPVWLVSLEGEWIDPPQQSEDGADVRCFRHYELILSMETGRYLQGRMRP